MVHPFIEKAGAGAGAAQELAGKTLHILEYCTRVAPLGVRVGPASREDDEEDILILINS